MSIFSSASNCAGCDLKITSWRSVWQVHTILTSARLDLHLISARIADLAVRPRHRAEHSRAQRPRPSSLLPQPSHNHARRRVHTSHQGLLTRAVMSRSRFDRAVSASPVTSTKLDVEDRNPDDRPRPRSGRQSHHHHPDLRSMWSTRVGTLGPIRRRDSTLRESARGNRNRIWTEW